MNASDPPLLLCYAASLEGERVAARYPDLVLRVGVGKVEASLSLARELARRSDALPRLVLVFGVCGAYPRRHRDAAVEQDLEVGQLCLVARDRLADDGVLTSETFLDLAALDLGTCGPFEADPRWTRRIAEILGASVHRRSDLLGATVSTCSASEDASQTLARRSGARVESMEGAALARVCEAFAVPYVQLRCVSNFTGDRARGAWDLRAACARVQEAVLTVCQGHLEGL